MPKAKTAAEKAVALDPGSAQAHTALAAVKLDYDWDRDGAARELRKALQLNPGSAWAQHWYAHSLEAQGNYDEAIGQFRASLTLDPLSVPLYWDLSNELIASKRYDEALALIAKGTELFPNVPLLLMEEAAAHYGKGDTHAGDAVVATMKAMGPTVTNEPFFLAFFGIAAAREGRPAEGGRILERVELMRRNRYVEPALVVDLCAALHDKRKELWRQRVIDERSTLFLYQPLLEKYLVAMMNQ